MTRSITTFLMFEGRAEEAMTLYTSLVPNSEILHITRYGPEGPGREGTVIHAIFTLNGQRVMASDSPVEHRFTFTPSISFYIDCETAAEQEALFTGLSQDGMVYMPLDDYGFSTRFGWVGDRFGVSWQINLA